MRRQIRIRRVHRIRIERNIADSPSEAKGRRPLALTVILGGMLIGVLVRVSELDHELKGLGLIPALFTGTIVAWCYQWLLPNARLKFMAFPSMTALGILTLGLYLSTLDGGVGFIKEIQRSPELYGGMILTALGGIALGKAITSHHLVSLLRDKRWIELGTPDIGWRAAPDADPQIFTSLISGPIFGQVRSTLTRKLRWYPRRRSRR